MTRAFVLPVVLAGVLGAAASVNAAGEDPLTHPSIREVVHMVNGGVASDVILERMRRMPAPPMLDARALGKLREKGVPDKVLLELTRTLPARDCDVRGGIPGWKPDLRKVLRHPAIQEVLREVDAGVRADVLLERVRKLPSVPTLDARALTKLTSAGVPDAVLLALVRRQSVAPETPASHAQLLAEVGNGREAPDPLVHRSIGEIMLMLQEGIGEDVIVERIRHLREVPALDACTIERLGAQGVPDDILLELLRRRSALSASKASPAELPTMVAQVVDTKLEAPSPPRSKSRERAEESHPEEHSKKKKGRTSELAEPASVVREGVGRIRVVAESSLPVTYLEVLLNGDIVSHRGEVQEGQTTPGWTLPRPPVVDVRKGLVVYESELPAGRYEVQTSFALSRIVETDWDPVVEAYGQRYETTSAGPSGKYGDVPVCELLDGRTCTVYARLSKHGDRYSVAYEAKLR